MAHSFSVKTKFIENVWVVFAPFLLISATAAASSEAPNGRDLVEKSLAAGERNEVRVRSYVSRSQSDLKQFAPDGSTKSEEVKTFDDVVVEGFHLRSLVAKDGKPLGAPELKKEQARIARLVAQRKSETPQARDKRLAEVRDKIEKDHRFTHELLSAFDFHVVGQESLEGRKAWVLDAEPHPGYVPKELKAQMFPHIRGRIWIDQEDFLWAKAEANVVDAFSLGFSVIAKINPGGHLSLLQIRQPDGTWVVSKVAFKGSGRIALVKRFSVESVTTSSNFRKVAPDRRIVEIKEDF